MAMFRLMLGLGLQLGVGIGLSFMVRFMVGVWGRTRHRARVWAVV
jgi:hypothetical protein